MSKRFSYRSGDNLICAFSLIFDPQGNVRLTRGPSALDADERELRTTVTLPFSIFQRPQLSANITIADTPLQDPVIDVEAARTALRDAFGADVNIEITQAEARG